MNLDNIPRARNDDPETSRMAAARLSTAQSHCYAMLLEAYKISQTDSPLFTDEVLQVRTGLPEGHKRTSDLRNAGLIRWVYRRDGTLRKVLGSNGRQVGVSRITPAGIAEIEQSRVQSERLP